MLHWFQELRNAREVAYAKLADRFLLRLLSHVAVCVFFRLYKHQYGDSMGFFKEVHYYIMEQCEDDRMASTFSDWLLGAGANTTAQETSWYDVPYSSWKMMTISARETMIKFTSSITAMFIPSYSAVIDLASSLSTKADAVLLLAPCYAMHVASGILTIASTTMFYWLSKMVPQSVRMALIAACGMWTHGMSVMLFPVLALIFAGLMIHVHYISVQMVKQHRESVPTAHDLMKAFVSLDDWIRLGSWFVVVSAAGTILYTILSL